MFVAPLLTEQQFFEKVKQLAQCQEDFLSQTQEHFNLKEEFRKQGKTEPNAVLCTGLHDLFLSGLHNFIVCSTLNI